MKPPPLASWQVISCPIFYFAKAEYFSALTICLNILAEFVSFSFKYLKRLSILYKYLFQG
jgi:hypothetical protein